MTIFCLFLSLSLGAPGNCVDPSTDYECAEGQNTVLVAVQNLSNNILIIPSWATEIQSNSTSRFSFPSGITSLYFEANSQLTSIGSSAFADNYELTRVFNFPLISISDRVFFSCPKLDSFLFKGADEPPLGVLFVPKTIPSLGNECFSYCDFLSIIFENGSQLSSIGSQAFAVNFHLTQVFNFSLVSISDGLFDSCSKLSIVSFSGEPEPTPGVLFIPKKITSIGNNSFRSCDYSTITFETNSQLSYLGSGAFASKSHLTRVFNYPLVSISDSLFDYCTILNFVSFSGEAESSGGVLSVPKRITFIGNRSFYRCNFTSITFETNSQLSYLGSYAFAINLYIASVFNYPLVSFSENLFYACQPLNFVSFIGEADPSAGVLSIPKTITSIGDNSFDYCNFTAINFDVDSQLSYFGSYAIGYNPFLTRVYNYPLVSISEGLFDCCYPLNYFSFRGEVDPSAGVLSIPKTITSIGRNSFYECNFTSIIFETNSNIASIEYGAFGFNSYLTSVINFPLVSISDWLFRDCTRLIFVSFSGEAEPSAGVLFVPKKITYIGTWSFYDCDFRTIIFEDNSSCSRIEPYAFYTNSYLQSVYGFPRLSTISGNLFGDCSNLKLFTTSSYSDAANLEEGLYLYEELTTIKSRAFYDTNFSFYILPSGKSLSDITIESDALPAGIKPSATATSFPSTFSSSVYFSQPSAWEDVPSNSRNAVIVGVTVAVVCLIVIVIVIIVYFWHKRKMAFEGSLAVYEPSLT